MWVHVHVTSASLWAKREGRVWGKANRKACCLSGLRAGTYLTRVKKNRIIKVELFTWKCTLWKIHCEGDAQQKSNFAGHCVFWKLNGSLKKISNFLHPTFFFLLMPLKHGTHRSLQIQMIGLRSTDCFFFFFFKALTPDSSPSLLSFRFNVANKILMAAWADKKKSEKQLQLNKTLN